MVDCNGSQMFLYCIAGGRMLNDKITCLDSCRTNIKKSSVAAVYCYYFIVVGATFIVFKLFDSDFNCYSLKASARLVKKLKDF